MNASYINFVPTFLQFAFDPSGGEEALISASGIAFARNTESLLLTGDQASDLRTTARKCIEDLFGKVQAAHFTNQIQLKVDLKKFSLLRNPSYLEYLAFALYRQKGIRMEKVENTTHPRNVVLVWDKDNPMLQPVIERGAPDFCFVVKGKEVLCHKKPIMEKSESYRPLCASAVRHNYKGKASPEAFQIMLQFLEGKIKDLPGSANFNQLVELYHLGEDFKLPFLKRICLEKISSKLTFNNVLETAQLASTFETKGVHEAVETFLIEKLPTMSSKEKEQFTELAKTFGYVSFLIALWKSSNDPLMKSHYENVLSTLIYRNRDSAQRIYDFAIVQSLVELSKNAQNWLLLPSEVHAPLSTS